MNVRNIFVEWGLLGVIVFLGAFLRFFAIGEQSLWIDEGFTLTQTEAIARHGFPLLDSGYIEKKDSLLPYLIAPFSSLWNAFHPAFPRGAVALFGTLSIVIAFLIGKAFQGKALALTFAFLVAFSSDHIAWSRQIRGYEVAVFFILLATLFFLRFTRTQKSIFLFWSIATAILAALSKSFGAIILPVILISALIARNTIQNPRSLPVLVFGIGSILVFIIIFFSTFFGSIHFDHPTYFTHYIFGALWGSFGILLPLALLGFTKTAKAPSTPIRRGASLAFGGFFLLTLLFFSFFVSVQEDRYLLLATPILLLFAGSMIVSLSETIPLKKWARLPVILLLLIALDTATTRSFLFVPQKIFALERNTPQPPFKSAYVFLSEKIAPEDALISPYPFLDRLFLGRSTFSLPLSYTGKSGDSNIVNGKEYYSGVRNLFANGKESGERKLASLRKTGSVYILLDALALRRIDSRILEIIQKDAEIVLQESFQGDISQAVFVYRLPKIDTRDPQKNPSILRDP